MNEPKSKTPHAVFEKNQGNSSQVKPCLPFYTITMLTCKSGYIIKVSKKTAACLWGDSDLNHMQEEGRQCSGYWPEQMA